MNKKNIKTLPHPLEWKTLNIKFEMTCPTLGDVRDLAKALVDTGIAQKLSVERFNLCCVLANLILDDELVNHPIFPKSRLKKKKARDLPTCPGCGRTAGHHVSCPHDYRP